MDYIYRNDESEPFSGLTARQTAAQQPAMPATPQPTTPPATVDPATYEQPPAELEAEIERDLGILTNAAPQAGANSMREALNDAIGHYVITESLLGTHNTIVKEGVLTKVLTNGYYLYDEAIDTYIICDYYSLKFFYRLPVGGRPARHGGDDAAIRSRLL
ncbi:MAG: hypothetical protein Q4B96_05505 [Bacillota bacterium]|nr:hypothetical protein [Bacillota bacterium]